MPYIRHNLGRTFYLCRGKGSRLPLVFLHGGPGGSHDTVEPALGLGKDRKVFLYDQIGGGRSSATARRHWNVETFVRELESLLRAWKIEEFHLGGSSWGCTLALEYFLRKKGRGVKSLIFGSPMFSAADWKRDADHLIAKLPKKFRQALQFSGAADSKEYEAALLEFYLRHVLRDKKKLLALMKRFSGPDPGKKIYKHMWGPSEFEPTGTLLSYDRRKELAKINVPTLFLCGEFDEARPATVKKYQRTVRGSKMSILRGCSHACLLENPKLMLKEMRAFLNYVEDSPGHGRISRSPSSRPRIKKSQRKLA